MEFRRIYQLDRFWLNHEAAAARGGTKSLARERKENGGNHPALKQTRPIIADNLLRQKMLAIRPVGLLRYLRK